MSRYIYYKLCKKEMRKSKFPIHPVFLERYSCKGFSEQLISQESINTLLEAARWAPSSFNEQPWRFLIPRNEEEKETYLQLLVPSNYEWVRLAPFFCYLLGKKKFTHGDKTKENTMHIFDAGAAWTSIALQAQLLGLNAHALAGFYKDKAYEVLDIDQNEFEIIIGLAVGISAQDSKKQKKSQRKPLSSLKLKLKN